MVMKATCPSCGTKGPISHFLVDERYKSMAITALSAGGIPADLIAHYLACFAPTGGRAIRADYFARICVEFATLISDGYVKRKGVRHPVTTPLWIEGIDAVLAARDAGTLSLPLDSHNYLAEAVWRLAGKARYSNERAAPIVSNASHGTFEDTPSREVDIANEVASLQKLIDAATEGPSRESLQRQLDELRGASNE